jgi:hypothetical protein
MNCICAFILDTDTQANGAHAGLNRRERAQSRKLDSEPIALHRSHVSVQRRREMWRATAEKNKPFTEVVRTERCIMSNMKQYMVPENWYLDRTEERE